MKRTALALAAFAALASLPSIADAGSRISMCAAFYRMRNDFYNERGLCFTRPGALRLYPDNPYTCRYRSSYDVPISASEKSSIDGIVANERALGCPRP